MNTVSATLDDVLALRDRRLLTQCELLAKHRKPLVSFTLNIAGPHKRTPLIDFAFERYVHRIHSLCGTPVEWRENRFPAGNEAVFVYEGRAETLKTLALRLEEQTPVGRLLDIDVLCENGTKLSRRSTRTCLICGGPVMPCARSRAHSVAELEAKTTALLKAFAVSELGELAVRALLCEVRLTPKPGLVDRANSGAHSDMDLALMERSAGALLPYFFACARIGLDGAEPAALQAAGRRAEVDMLRCTNGVNTHKGAIYTMGLLCAAYGGVLSGADGDAFTLAAQIARQLAVSPAETSHGRLVQERYGAAGIRAEAYGGFPHVRGALSLLRSGVSPLRTLLALLEQVEDTNLLYRGGEDGLRFVRSHAAALCDTPDKELPAALRRFDCECIARHLSPGGSADLLAAAFFLRSLDPLAPPAETGGGQTGTSQTEESS